MCEERTYASNSELGEGPLVVVAQPSGRFTDGFFWPKRPATREQARSVILAPVIAPSDASITAPVRLEA